MIIPDYFLLFTSQAKRYLVVSNLSFPLHFMALMIEAFIGGLIAALFTRFLFKTFLEGGGTPLILDIVYCLFLASFQFL